MSIQDTIRIADVSQYLSENDIDESGLYGGGMDIHLPKKIYCVKKSLEWGESHSDKTYKNAIGYVTINTVGNPGDKIEVFVNDPELGIISLGYYVLTATDLTPTIITSNLALAMGGTVYECGIVGNYINTQSNFTIITQNRNSLTTETI
jgi:hypothetical protein